MKPAPTNSSDLCTGAKTICKVGWRQKTTFARIGKEFSKKI
jgi:hypothetical protein